MTFADNSFNMFVQGLGGKDFLGLYCACLIIIAIILALIKPFDF